MNSQLKIYIVGNGEMVKSAIMRNLQSIGYQNIITRTHAKLDLIKQAAVANFLD